MPWVEVCGQFRSFRVFDVESRSAGLRSARALHGYRLDLTPGRQIPLGRSVGRFRLAIRNTVLSWTQRRLAVVVHDGEGALYKTKVR